MAAKRSQTKRRKWSEADFCEAIIQGVQVSLRKRGIVASRTNAARYFLGIPMERGIIQGEMNSEHVMTLLPAGVLKLILETYGADLACLARALHQLKTGDVARKSASKKPRPGARKIPDTRLKEIVRTIRAGNTSIADRDVTSAVHSRLKDVTKVTIRAQLRRLKLIKRSTKGKANHH